MDIRQLREADQAEWVRLRMALWPDSDEEDIRDEFDAYLEGGDRRLLCMVVERPNGLLAGMIELELRLQAEGCFSSPVAYITGWYVDEDVRRQGLAKRLLESVTNWARKIGCAEIASDCVIDNESAVKVHEALGFEEVSRLAHFVYELPAEG